MATDFDWMFESDETCEECSETICGDEALFEDGDSYCRDCYGDIFGDVE